MNQRYSSSILLKAKPKKTAAPGLTLLRVRGILLPATELT